MRVVCYNRVAHMDRTVLPLWEHLLAFRITTDNLRNKVLGVIMTQATANGVPIPTMQESYDMGLATVLHFLKSPYKYGCHSRQMGQLQVADYIIWVGQSLREPQYEAIATDRYGNLLQRRSGSDPLPKREPQAQSAMLQARRQDSERQVRPMSRQLRLYHEIEEMLVSAVATERSKHGCDPDGSHRIPGGNAAYSRGGYSTARHFYGCVYGGDFS